MLTLWTFVIWPVFLTRTAVSQSLGEGHARLSTQSSLLSRIHISRLWTQSRQNGVAVSGAGMESTSGYGLCREINWLAPYSMRYVHTYTSNAGKLSWLWNLLLCATVNQKRGEV